jgi:DNA uptake protein ComE-like DNA-binding protein
MGPTIEGGTMKRTGILLAVTALAIALAPLQAQVGKSQGLLDANRATQQELMTVLHLNADLVKAILDKRPFANVTELAAVLTPPLTKVQLTEVYGKVFVHVNLNTATDDEITSIPAAQPARILREFKEYRPYKSLADFHREMRKYWDEVEVSRLEQYVFVPVKLNTATDEEILTIPAAQPNRILREFKEYRPYTSMEQFHREMRKYWDEKEVNRLQRYVTLN